MINNFRRRNLTKTISKLENKLNKNLKMTYYEIIGKDINGSTIRMEIEMPPYRYYSDPKERLREIATQNGLRPDHPLEIRELSELLNHIIK